jgi:VWFA-related protein
MYFRALTAAVAVALLASGQAAPQQAPPAAQQPPRQPTFKTGAELVRIDAGVVDNKGLSVTTLTAEDFAIEEDGVPQKIQTFKLIRLDGSETHEPWASDDVQPFELARDDIRVFLVFWDEYHIPPHFVAARMRQDLTNFVRTMLGPRDVVAIMDVWTPMSHLKFTRDSYSLLPQISGLRGRQGEYTPPRNGAEETHLREGKIELRRAEVAYTALQSAMAHMSTLRPGRTNVLYVGREFIAGYDPRESMNTTNETIRVANDANVAVFSMNPDGLPMRTNRMGFLTDVSHNTGGQALMTNDLNVAFERATQATSAYYLIGYAPEPLRHDGKFHEVKVRVKKGGMHVRAREGYWAPSATEQIAERKKVEASAVAQPIEQAFGQFSRLDRADAEATTIETIFVPETSLDTIRVGDPQIWVVRRPADLRDILGDSRPAPEAGRVFARTERLIVRFALSGSAAADGKVTVGLVDRKGKRLTDLPARADGAGWLVDLPLTSLARADFLLAIEARAGADLASAYVPLRVAR